MSRIETIVQNWKERMCPSGIPLKGCLIECFRAASENGGVTESAKMETERLLNVSRTELDGVLSFYDHFEVKEGASGHASEKLFTRLLGDKLKNFVIRVRGPLLRIASRTSYKIAKYLQRGGYAAVKKALAMSQEDIVNMLKASGLRGRGGAWFPAWLKIASAIKENAVVKFLVANADEGEPPTIKDWVLLTYLPHQLIEGMIIAAHAIGNVRLGVIYLRGDYTLAYERLLGAISEAEKAGFLGPNALGPGKPFNLYVFRGAGSYVAGADTAQLQSIMGNRACSQSVPPYPTQSGLAGKPTVVMNVETLCCVPRIIEHGGEWFAKIGSPSSPGTKIFSLCGDIVRPGVYEVPTGVTLRKLIFKYGGGVKGGTFLAAIPGGVTSGFVTNLDAVLDVQGMRDAGAGLGSGAVTVLNHHADIPGLCRDILRFYTEESCGNCLPCPLGLRQAEIVLDRLISGVGKPEEVGQIAQIKNMLARSARCGLGQGALTPIVSAIQNFPAVFGRKE